MTFLAFVYLISFIGIIILNYNEERKYPYMSKVLGAVASCSGIVFAVLTIIN